MIPSCPWSYLEDPTTPSRSFYQSQGDQLPLKQSTISTLIEFWILNQTQFSLIPTVNNGARRNGRNQSEINLEHSDIT